MPGFWHRRTKTLQGAGAGRAASSFSLQQGQALTEPRGPCVWRSCLGEAAVHAVRGHGAASGVEPAPWELQVKVQQRLGCGPWWGHTCGGH